MTENHRRKFQTISPKPRPGPKPKVVVNLSSRLLYDNEELVLAKDLNYAISPKSIPKEGVIAWSLLYALYRVSLPTKSGSK
ncbi:hypothetical protein Trydic_g1788 [Trypoxylus dichotomus]